MIYKIIVCGSSSDGNCIQLFFNKHIISLDAGVKQSQSRFPINNLTYDKIFISHDHNDHIDNLSNMKEKEKTDIKILHEFFVSHRVKCKSYIFKCESKIVWYLTDFNSFIITDELLKIIPKVDFFFCECNWNYERMNNVKEKNIHQIITTGPGGHSSDHYVRMLFVNLPFKKECMVMFTHLSTSHIKKSDFHIFNNLEQKWTIAEKDKTYYVSGGDFKIV